MGATGSSVPTNSDWVDSLLEWWSPPSDFGSDDFAAWAKRLQGFSLDVQRHCYEACCAQAEAMWTTNERLSRSLQASLTSGRRQEVLAAQAETVNHLLAGLATQANVWAELTQNLHKCCCTFTEETAEKSRVRPETGKAGASTQAGVVKAADKVAV